MNYKTKKNNNEKIREREEGLGGNWLCMVATTAAYGDQLEYGPSFVFE